jgi:hypothetical protein
MQSGLRALGDSFVRAREFEEQKRATRADESLEASRQAQTKAYQDAQIAAQKARLEFEKNVNRLKLTDELMKTIPGSEVKMAGAAAQARAGGVEVSERYPGTEIGFGEVPQTQLQQAPAPPPTVAPAQRFPSDADGPEGGVTTFDQVRPPEFGPPGRGLPQLQGPPAPGAAPFEQAPPTGGFGMQLRQPQAPADPLAPPAAAPRPPQAIESLTPGDRTMDVTMPGAGGETVSRNISQERGWTRDMLAREGNAIINQATNKLDRMGRQLMVESVMDSWMLHGDPEKASKEMGQWQQFTEKERNDLTASRMAAAAMRMSKGDTDFFKIGDRVRKVIDKVKTDYGIQKLATQERFTAKARTMMASPNAASQRLAIAAAIKSAFDSRPSDKEAAYVREASGKLQVLLAEFNSWAKGGKIPETYAEQFIEAMDIMDKEAKEHRHSVGLLAMDRVQSDQWLPMTPEQRKYTAMQAYADVAGVKAGLTGPTSLPGGQRAAAAAATKTKTTGPAPADPTEAAKAAEGRAQTGKLKPSAFTQ